MRWFNSFQSDKNGELNLGKQKLVLKWIWFNHEKLSKLIRDWLIMNNCDPNALLLSCYSSAFTIHENLSSIKKRRIDPEMMLWKFVFDIFNSYLNWWNSFVCLKLRQVEIKLFLASCVLLIFSLFNTRYESIIFPFGQD